jgi:hypothetical protein
MVVGFNHNFPYKGTIYHIQTEDGGRGNPTIVTLLYRGGTILASRKTSYADITRIDNLSSVVEELMKDQHKEMLRSLKNGEFDDAIARFVAGPSPGPAASAPAAGQPAPADTVPAPAPAQVQPAPADAVPAPADAVPAPAPAPAAAPRAAPPASPAGSAAATEPPRPAAGEASLDEIILSYLLGEEK